MLEQPTLSQIYEALQRLEDKVSRLHKAEMTNAEICRYCGITQATLLNWRKYKGFPSHATIANIEHWMALGNGKNKRSGG